MSRTAILFPGQGAQAVGMGKDLAEAFPECRAIFDRANEVLAQDLAKLCFEGPIEELTKSSNAQPAIFVVSLACLAALKKLKPGLTFAAAAGLSSGEWTALHVAGAVTFEDTLKVLQARGRFMQQACEENPGTMLSVIGLGEDGLRKVCAEAGIEMANLNSPEQTVLSGKREGIELAEKLVKAAGAKKGIRLNVAGAFHSSLMAPAARRLEEFLAGVRFQAPTMPVVSNVTGAPHTAPDSIRKLMVQQVTGSVHWVSCVRWMQGQGVNRYVECGPGKVLTGLVKRIDNAAFLNNILDRSSLEAAVAALGNP
ncbi:MAG: ACP S-malonyltransferase [Verrucomicrobiota bacterium]